MAIINPGDNVINETQVDGTELARRLERFYASFHSLNSSQSRPPALTAGGAWSKPVTGGFDLMMFDGTQDIKIGGVVNGQAQLPDSVDGTYVKLTGNQTVAGVKTFSDTIVGNVSGNAGTVTNGVYTAGDQTIGGAKTLTGPLNVQSTITASGNITSSGNVTAFSDERLKTNWKDLPTDFVEQLSTVLSGTYDRVDTGDMQVGVSAQSLQKILPTAVNESSDGVLSVAYGNAALAACIALAKRVIILEEKLNGNSQ
jgi:hypothetical protein